ncbi:uncharacterized protein LOC111245569 isoform X1 [Varroa destructor]|uniref:Uncharacterized protein n=1 Tax=Varroa destructor TaxID=109461 RepID=A0A7M7JC13_VARDE|nr:uncharacterized protein LOC111245569 isoform X1 [Varroa destructor]
MVVAALSDRWRKLMSQLTIDTSSNSKISLNTREELREALHNESTRSYASTFDITDDIGVLEDSVFETGNLAPGISGSGLFPAQLRKMVLRTLFIMVAAYLTVLVLMFAPASCSLYMDAAFACKIHFRIAAICDYFRLRRVCSLLRLQYVLYFHNKCRLFGDLHANYSSLVRWSRVDFEKDPRFYFVSACRQYDRRVCYHLFNNFMLATRSGRSRSCGCCPAGCDSLQNSHHYQAFLAEQLCLSCAHLNRVPYKHMFIVSVHIHLLGDVK